MGYDAVWPAFVCMAVLLFVALLPIMRAADSPPSQRRQRVSSIDGIRGFLAFGVYFHHVVISYPSITRGIWDVPQSHFYRMAGPVAVDIFFMITGYLFWTKAIKEKGRMNLLKLYIGRVFRIGPLYVFAILLMLAVLAIKTHFHLREPVRTVVAESADWLALGVILPREVNSYTQTNYLLAGVTWTLHYEWIFYFSLALTSFLAALKSKFLIVGIAAYSLSLLALSLTEPSVTQAIYLSSVALFLAGMICASLESNQLLFAARPYVKSLALVVLVAYIFAGSWIPNTAIPLFLVFLVFYLVISGSTFFGLLTSRAANRLGNISYGVYLLQGLVLTVGLSFGPVRDFVIESPWRYWSFALLCSLLLTALATLTHVFIERPGIDAGNRLIAGIERWRAGIKNSSGPTDGLRESATGT